MTFPRRIEGLEIDRATTRARQRALRIRADEIFRGTYPGISGARLPVPYHPDPVLAQIRRAEVLARMSYGRSLLDIRAPTYPPPPIGLPYPGRPIQDPGLLAPYVPRTTPALPAPPLVPEPIVEIAFPRGGFRARRGGGLRQLPTMGTGAGVIAPADARRRAAILARMAGGLR